MFEQTPPAPDSSSSSSGSANNNNNTYRQQQSVTSTGSFSQQQQPTRFRGGEQPLSSLNYNNYDNSNYSSTDKPSTTTSTATSHSSIYLFVVLIIVAATVLAVPFVLKTLPFQNRQQTAATTTKQTTGIQQQPNHNYQLTTPRPPTNINEIKKTTKQQANKMGNLDKLGIEIIKAGSSSAQVVAKANRVTVHALGSVLESGGNKKKFWSTRDAGQQPFKYTAGVGEVITGWDQGVLGMAHGEVRGISIPGTQGYGSQGFPAWGIPPNADLHFEIEVLAIDTTM
eukprot:GHVS01014093.1.p1 GENE.GHVS01014093.1~~GHVS01014093.1.p1  ORF type:complete len:283 (-),score=98.13 GHVS01014093.1:328-1176(-)